jgi:hypothetical protein
VSSILGGPDFVISGTWYFGYGDRHDEEVLQALGPGSFYTEPAREPHFARANGATIDVVRPADGSGDEIRSD